MSALTPKADIDWSLSNVPLSATSGLSRNDSSKKEDRLAAVSPEIRDLIFFSASKTLCALANHRRPYEFFERDPPSAWAIAGVSNELIDVCTGLPFPVMTHR